MRFRQRVSDTGEPETCPGRRILAAALAATIVLSFVPGASAADDSSSRDAEQKKDRDKSREKRKARGDAPCLCWIKAGIPLRAVLVCVHGLGLNSSSFEQLGQRMSPRGVAVYAIDVRGFGSWMKAQGKEDVDFKACMADVKSTLEWVKRAHPGLPVFLLGESMGGAIALQFTADNPGLVTGLISACASGDRFATGKTSVKVALHALTGPKRDFDIGSQIVDQATDKKSLAQEWENDPLNRMKLSPVELMQFDKFMRENHDAAKKIQQVPVLMVQGSKDGLVKPEGTKELFDEIACSDKQWLLVANGEHLIFEEGQFTDDVMAKVAQWMLSHAPAPLAGSGVSSSAGSSFGRSPVVVAACAQAKQALSAGNINAALAALEPLRQTGPQDPEVSLLMGQVFAKSNRPLKARQCFVRALKLGKGSPVAREANRMLMMLPQDVLAPNMAGAAAAGFPNLPVPQGFGPSGAMGNGLRQRQFPGRPGARARKFQQGGPMAAGGVAAPVDGSGLPTGVPVQNSGDSLANGERGTAPTTVNMVTGQPTVLVFNATWCEPCKDMSGVIDEAKSRFGNQVQFTTIDVDDEANTDLVEKYNIGPIPTTVFVGRDGRVADFCVGYAGIDGMVKGMAKIVSR